VATILTIFLRINIPNFVQLAQYWGQIGTMRFLLKARFYTNVNINNLNTDTLGTLWYK